MLRLRPGARRGRPLVSDAGCRRRCAAQVGQVALDEHGTVEERARIFPHLVGEQQRDLQLNAAVRAGIERLRGGFEMLARAAQERGELDPALDPEHFSRLPISLLQGLLIQLGVYGVGLDIDAYARAATALIDQPPAE